MPKTAKGVQVKAKATAALWQGKPRISVNRTGLFKPGGVPGARSSATKLGSDTFELRKGAPAVKLKSVREHAFKSSFNHTVMKPSTNWIDYCTKMYKERRTLCLLQFPIQSFTSGVWNVHHTWNTI